MKPRLSGFSALFIAMGLLYISFLLFYIASEVLDVLSTESLIQRKAQEVKSLEKKRNERLQTKYIMLSPQYQDRIAKESRGVLQSREIEILLPEILITSSTIVDPYLQSAEEISRLKSPREQWGDVFFKEKE